MSAQPGVGTVNAVIVDCIDPGMLAAFWAELLGLSVSNRDGNDWVDLRPIAAGGPILAFQRVPELKQVKNRLHLDVRVGGAGEDRMARLGAEADRLVALGARLLRRVEPDGAMEAGFITMADPEGNEFCLD